jgi:hypothetical protein
MVKLVSFTQSAKSASPVSINPEAVAAVSKAGEKTKIFMRAPSVNAHGLEFTVNEDIEAVVYALTR